MCSFFNFQSTPCCWNSSSICRVHGGNAVDKVDKIEQPVEISARIPAVERVSLEHAIAYPSVPQVKGREDILDGLEARGPPKSPFLRATVENGGVVNATLENVDLADVAEDEANPAEPSSLHLAIWNNDMVSLRRLLLQEPGLLNAEHHGTSPAGFAVRLMRLEAVTCLVESRANLLRRDKEGWSVAQRVFGALTDDNLLAEVARLSNHQAWHKWRDKSMQISRRLEEIPDCDITFTWVFSTWIPLAGKLLPEDTVRLRKAGSSLRVDYTLKTFSGMSWGRGQFSLLACTGKEGAVFFLDHDRREFDTLERRMIQDETLIQKKASRRKGHMPRRGYLNVNNVTVKATADLAQCGSFGKCPVYQIYGMEYRSMVLQNPPGVGAQASVSAQWRPLAKLVNGMAGGGTAAPPSAAFEVLELGDVFPHLAVTRAQECLPTVQAIPAATPKQSRTVQATVLLSPDFPLTRQQFVDIADVVAASDDRYAAVKDFFETSLPSGFPVQFQIPIFSALSATVSFTSGRICTHEPEEFVVPEGYSPKATDP
mmetsp:Transcript_45084/g.97936  ORF Transcript_45084/g.97936 Transcript_45084/m.97936 type:complete len:541 (-) Transcript_45084:50-1672(-)